MKKSLKLFSFKIILVNAAYSLLNKTVFGVIAAKLASRAEKSDPDLMIFQDERVIVNILTFAAATFTRTSWEFEFSEKQDVGQHRIDFNNLKIVVQIWNVTGEG